MAHIYQPPFGMLFLEIFDSVAFRSLSKNATDLYLYTLFKRKKDKRNSRSNNKHRGKNFAFQNIKFKITYKECRTNLGFADTTTSRAIQELLLKGCINLETQGGGYKGVYSEYSHSEKFLDWKKGDVFYEKPKDALRGYQGKNNENLKKTKKQKITIKRRLKKSK